ncbi:hypothetical protein B484DRAFT_391028 [Ochromonadaceae sp. CCMP2298]|nr:hypothetical protein B484DRAFT_391028 [Ochromonadaceae sp. CCMP2298]
MSIYGPQLQQWLRHYPTTVTSLSLRECYFLTDEGCKLLAARFPLLESLDLSGCPVSSTGAKKFLKCESLTQFRCETSSTGSRKDMTINPAYIKALAGAKNLQTLCKSVSGGSGGSGGSSGGGPTPLCNLPNLQVLAVLPRSKLVSIVISPCTAAQLSQWQALGPRNILGQQISLTIGEKWFK